MDGGGEAPDLGTPRPSRYRRASLALMVVLAGFLAFLIYVLAVSWEGFTHGPRNMLSLIIWFLVFLTIRSMYLLYLLSRVREYDLDMDRPAQRSMEAKAARMLKNLQAAIIVKRILMTVMLKMCMVAIYPSLAVVTQERESMTALDIAGAVLFVVVLTVVIEVNIGLVSDRRRIKRRGEWAQREGDRLLLSEPSGSIMLSLHRRRLRSVRIDDVERVIWSTNLDHDHRYVWLVTSTKGTVRLRQDRIPDEAEFRSWFEGRLEDRHVDDGGTTATA